MVALLPVVVLFCPFTNLLLWTHGGHGGHGEHGGQHGGYGGHRGPTPTPASTPTPTPTPTVLLLLLLHTPHSMIFSLSTALN